MKSFLVGTSFWQWVCVLVLGLVILMLVTAKLLYLKRKHLVKDLERMSFIPGFFASLLLAFGVLLFVPQVGGFLMLFLIILLLPLLGAPAMAIWALAVFVAGVWFSIASQLFCPPD